MNKKKLSTAIRNQADAVRDENDTRIDTREMLLVLARIIEGQRTTCAFGSIGGWGYDSPVGKALVSADKINA